MTTTGKSQIISTFATHVSSGKAAFFQSAGIDFVIGRAERPTARDADGE